MKFRLNHYCNKPGCIGKPGQVIDVSEENAAYLASVGGGKRIETAADPRPPRAEKGTPEEAPEDAASGRQKRAEKRSPPKK